MDEFLYFGHSMIMKAVFQLLLILFLLTNCAGYNLRTKTNPFKSYNINSIAVPMFINKTSLEKISQSYTNSVIEILSQYSNLSVSAGNIESEDAVLIGIINPTRQAHKGSIVGSHTLMTQEQKDSLGNRNAFDVTTTGAFDVTVDLMILKRPSREEIDFFTSELGKKAKSFPNMIFSQSVRINQSYSLENPVGDENSAALVRGVQNKGKLRKALLDSSVEFTNSFKEMMSNAF